MKMAEGEKYGKKLCFRDLLLVSKKNNILYKNNKTY